VVVIMDRAISFELLNEYLKRYSDITQRLLLKALLNNSLSQEENELAQEIGQTANVLSAIYFFRKDNDLERIISQMSDAQRRSMEKSFRLIWKHLSRLTETELADLTIDVIHSGSELISEVKERCQKL